MRYWKKPFMKKELCICRGHRAWRIRFRGLRREWLYIWRNELGKMKNTHPGRSSGVCIFHLPEPAVRRNHQPLVLCSQFHFQLLCQGGNDLVQIAYDTVIRYVKDRSGLILVDGNDEVGFFHTCQVLDRTGNTDCEVYVRTNGLTGLSNLQILRLPS